MLRSLLINQKPGSCGRDLPEYSGKCGSRIAGKFIIRSIDTIAIDKYYAADATNFYTNCERVVNLPQK
jgi:hypothetical protein